MNEVNTNEEERFLEKSVERGKGKRGRGRKGWGSSGERKGRPTGLGQRHPTKTKSQIPLLLF